MVFEGDTLSTYVRFSLKESEEGEPWYGSDDFIGACLYRDDGGYAPDDAETEDHGDNPDKSRTFIMKGDGARYHVRVKVDKL